MQRMCMQRMCMQAGQRKPENMDGHMWRYDWHGMVVLADERHWVVEQSVSAGPAADALRCRPHRRTQSRDAKAERKHWQLQRAGERRSKALRVRGIEFDDDSVY